VCVCVYMLYTCVSVVTSSLFERQSVVHIHTETDRQKDTHSQTHTHRQKDTHTHTHRHTHRDRQTHSQRQTENYVMLCNI